MTGSCAPSLRRTGIVSRGVGATITSPLGIGAPVQCVGPVSARGEVGPALPGGMLQYRRHEKVSTVHELVVDGPGALVAGELEEKPAPRRAVASTSPWSPAGRARTAVAGLTLRCRTTASPSVQRREYPGTRPSCTERPLRLSRPTRFSGLPRRAGRQGCVPRAPMPSSNPSPRRALRSTGPARRRREVSRPPALSRHK
jgi:hypothetical protein